MLSTINRNTGFTPNMMMLGREVMLPVDLMFGQSQTEGNMSSTDYVVKLQQILRQVHTLARETLQSSQEWQKGDYDLCLRVTTYEVGDIVYVLDSARKIGLSPKLKPVWKGPNVISKDL